MTVGVTKRSDILLKTYLYKETRMLGGLLLLALVGSIGLIGDALSILGLIVILFGIVNLF